VHEGGSVEEEAESGDEEDTELMGGLLIVGPSDRETRSGQYMPSSALFISRIVFLPVFL
jgi:hypothetical protein